MNLIDWMKASFAHNQAAISPGPGLTERVAAVVADINKIKISDQFVRGREFEEFVWRRIWLGIYLLNDFRLKPSVSEKSLDWHQPLYVAWPAFRIEYYDPASPFKSHLDSLLNGCHPWGAYIASYTDIPADVLVDAVLKKAERLARGELGVMSGSDVLASMRAYGH